MNSRISPREAGVFSRTILFAIVLTLTFLATSLTTANAASLSKLGSFSGHTYAGLELDADKNFIYAIDSRGPAVTIRRLDAQTGVAQVVFSATKGSFIDGGFIDEYVSSFDVRNGVIAFVTSGGWIENVVPETKDRVSSVVTVRASDGVARVIASGRGRYEQEQSIDSDSCGLSVQSVKVTTRQTVDVMFRKVGDPTENLRICPPTLIEESGTFVRSYSADGAGGRIVHRENADFWPMPDGRRFIALRKNGIVFVNKTNNTRKRVPVAGINTVDLVDASNRLGLILSIIRTEKNRHLSQRTLYPRFGSLRNGVRYSGGLMFCGSVIARYFKGPKRLNLLNKSHRVVRRIPVELGDSSGLYCSSSHLFVAQRTSTETEIFTAKLP